MSSLRAVLGRGLSTAVGKSGSEAGHHLTNAAFQKCWLSSYTLSRQFHSFQFRSTVNSAISVEPFQRKDFSREGLKWQWPTVGLHSSSTTYRNETRIDDSLNRLDVEIRKVGRIKRQEVDEILEDIKEMKKATSSQSLMIIRCCGELIPEEPPSSRTELVQQVWKTLESLNVAMDVSHYNALLRVYLENEHKFNPTEFLNDLTNKGIEPNRVTYQRLIARFCQEGDIDGASTILQHMKEKQLPINEYVFNALILGHGQANDMESAEGILGVMKQAGLEPNDDTYVTLMTCYAKHGDLTNVHRIAKECEEKEIFLIDRDFLSVIYALAANNHQALIDEVLPYLKKHSGFNQEATSLIFRLVNIGQEETAFKILKQMTPIMRQEEPVPSGNFFIKHLIQLSRPAETIVKYCKELQKEGLHPFAFSRAAEFALMSKKFDLAVEFFESMQQTGLPIRQHYFWPFFASATTERDVKFALRCMKDLGHTPNMETLRDYIIPNALSKRKESIERTLQKLSSTTGLPVGNLASAAMMHLLSNNELKLAADFAAQYRLRFKNLMLGRSIVDAYIRTKDAESFVKIIGSSSLDGNDNAREDVGFMLMELVDAVRSPERKAAFIEPVLQQLVAHGLGLSNSGSELLQNKLGEALTPELATVIGQLTSSELTSKISFSPDQSLRRGMTQQGQLEDKSSEELEQMLAEAIRKNSPTKGIRKSLIYSYCRDRNVEKLDKLKQELEKEEFVFTTGLHAMFLDVYSSVGRIEDAKKSYEAIKAGLDSRMDDLKILRFASALQNSGDLEGCIDVLKTAPRDDSRKPTGGAQQVTIWKLLSAVSDLGPEKAKEVFNILNERNLTPVNNVTLGPLIKAYLTKDDLDGALQEFERCVQQHRVTPWKQELFCRFIKLEDADRLQKVMDLSTSIHGEVNSMYDLVFAFIDCGKLRQARKILETPGLRARNDKIELYCQRYCQENRIEELENLLEVTKDLMDVDRNSMYFYLLQAYCKAGNPDKALSVWTSMQEENVQPSVELLIYLADFLQKNNCSVPFVVPDPSEMMTSSISSEPVARGEVPQAQLGLPKSIVEFRRCIDMNEIDKALQIKQRIAADGSTLNITDTSNLILKLARAERLNEATRLSDQLFDQQQHPLPRTLRFLVARLANAGDVNALERMEEKLTPELKRFSMLNSRLCIAYTNANRGQEYFENHVRRIVESGQGAKESDSTTKPTDDASAEDQDELGNIPVLGISTLLRRNENLLPEFEDLASKANGLHQRAMHNALYIYFMSKKEFSRAREIWDSLLKSESRVLFRTVALDARKDNDVELATTLASHVLEAPNLRSRAKGVASSCALDVLGGTGKIDEALTHLEEALKKVTLEDYPVSVLERLKQHALASNKTFPYNIPQAAPQRQQGRRRRPADSSDSDSD